MGVTKKYRRRGRRTGRSRGRVRSARLRIGSKAGVVRATSANANTIRTVVRGRNPDLDFNLNVTEDLHIIRQRTKEIQRQADELEDHRTRIARYQGVNISTIPMSEYRLLMRSREAVRQFDSIRARFSRNRTRSNSQSRGRSRTRGRRRNPSRSPRRSPSRGRGRGRGRRSRGRRSRRRSRSGPLMV